MNFVYNSAVYVCLSCLYIFSIQAYEPKQISRLLKRQFSKCKMSLYTRCGGRVSRCININKQFYATMTSNEARRKFIEFFQNEHAHEFIPSSSIKLPNDRTLLFVNAGMNRFKPKFLETIDPSDKLAPVSRAVNSQKCIRAGGKHNDLEDVGKDTSHHTFFEMLGSWSFGDYFKEKACEMALELLTAHFKLPVDKLFFTYFSGDEKLGLECDRTTHNIWKSLGIPENRILPFGMKDNFWEMGDVGPCGPCTEIHYDYTGNSEIARNLVNVGHPDVVEIWNLVFMQYNRLASDQLVLLPTNHVDTGLGLERIAAVLQDKKSNYDTDLFIPIIRKIEEICGSPKYTGGFSPMDQAYRIVSDHIRMLVIAISDHVYPGNVAAELIVRRVLRRAYLNAKQHLSAPDGLLQALVPVVVETLCSHYSYLNERQSDIITTISNEEKGFVNVLTKGQKMFSKALRTINDKNFPVETTILLYNHFGYPLTLLQKKVEDAGLILDMQKFDRYQDGREELKKYGRESVKDEEQTVNITSNVVNQMRSKNIPFTNSNEKYNYTRNEDGTYTFPTPSSTVLALVSDDGKLIDSVKTGQKCAIVLESTCFYHTDGGQVSDTGFITFDQAEAFQVAKVTFAGGFIFHHGVCCDNFAEIQIGDRIEERVNTKRRQACMRAHTATHILNHALREILSPDIRQQGSKIDEDSLRFTYNGPTPSNTQLRTITQAIRTQISRNITLNSKFLPLNEALSDSNIRRLSDGIYSDPSRVVSIGESKLNNHSVELCGGTHVLSTEDVGHVVLISSKSQGLHRTTIRFLTDKRAEESDELLQMLQRKVKLKTDESWSMLSQNLGEVEQYENMKKEIGRLNYEVNSAEISIVCKTELKAKLRKQSQKLTTQIKLLQASMPVKANDKEKE